MLTLGKFLTGEKSVRVEEPVRTHSMADRTKELQVCIGKRRKTWMKGGGMRLTGIELIYYMFRFDIFVCFFLIFFLILLGQTKLLKDCYVFPDKHAAVHLHDCFLFPSSG